MKKLLLQTILDNDKKGIFVYQDYEYKFVNKSFANILGYSQDEFKEKKYLENVHVQCREKIRNLINNIFTDQLPEIPDKIKYRAIDRNNNIVWIRLRPSLIYYNKKPALLGKIQRIQPPKREVQEKNKYGVNVEDSSKIFYVINKKGKFLYISNTIGDLGWNPNSLIGKHFSNILHPDDVENVASSTVLPKYKNVITGPSMAPKLFDERRTGNRKTKNLKVRLIKNIDHDQENEEELRYIPTLVDAAGLYTSDVTSYNKEQIGTVGVIREKMNYA